MFILLDSIYVHQTKPIYLSLLITIGYNSHRKKSPCLSPFFSPKCFWFAFTFLYLLLWVQTSSYQLMWNRRVPASVALVFRRISRFIRFDIDQFFVFIVFCVCVFIWHFAWSVQKSATRETSIRLSAWFFVPVLAGSSVRASVRLSSVLHFVSFVELFCSDLSSFESSELSALQGNFFHFKFISFFVSLISLCRLRLIIFHRFFSFAFGLHFNRDEKHLIDSCQHVASAQINHNFSFCLSFPLTKKKM